MHSIDSDMAGPDDPRVDGPAIFERGVLRHGHTARDSVVIEAIAQRGWSRIVAPVPAVAAVDVVLVVELVVYLDVELVIRGIRRCGPVVVVEFVRVAGLRIKTEDGDSDRVDFVRYASCASWNYIGHLTGDLLAATVKANLRPDHIAQRPAIHSRVVNVQRQIGAWNHILREVALPLRQSRHGRVSAGCAGAPDLLKINEEERSVFPDRAAQGESTLVASAIRFRVGYGITDHVLGIEEVAGVHLRT